ncbi:hypothetical protein GGI10_005430 [Coemansia sp. RSA 2530]|nr:hypothetical protein GGI10_005430 [Coemansia sp. RSA 2530]
MESRLSPFQALPMLVVYKIVEYLEGRSRSSFSLDIGAHNKGKEALTPLLSVSERWSLHTRKTHLAKRVIVSATLWKEMYDGTFCDVITRSQYENMPFPSANTLLLNLSKTAVQPTPLVTSPGVSFLPAPPVAPVVPVAVSNEEKVAGFARALLRLTPATTDVVVSFNSLNNTDPNSPQLYSTLVSELCRGGVRGLQVCSEIKATIVAIDLRCVSGLVSIKQEPGMDSASFAQLAYRNASTLKHLAIEVATEADWRSLIYGGTEAPVVYANLAWLELRIKQVPYTETWAAIKELVPFPVLLTLDVCGEYPFDDDLLFRGNGATLRTLRLPFGAMTRDILARFNVFKRCDSIQMSSICLGPASVEDNAFIAQRATESIGKQMHLILGATTSLILSDNTSGLALTKAIYAVPSTSALRSLVYTNLVFDLTHIIHIIAALPSLASFTCEVRGLSSNIGDIPANERPEALRSAYYPLSKPFGELHVPYTAASSADKVAIVAMQLAVLCPKFAYVDLQPKLRNAFSREVAWASCNYSFEPYASSIRCLIYRDLDG